MLPFFFLLGLGALLLVLLLAAMARPRRPRLRGEPFERRPLIDADAQPCLRALEAVLDPSWRLCPAVSAKALLVPMRRLGRRQRRLAQETLQPLLADFVICAAGDLYPLVVVRLSAPRQSRATARDGARLQRAGSAAGLPVIELAADALPSSEALKALIHEAVALADVRIAAVPEATRSEDEVAVLEELSLAMREDDSARR